MTPDVVKVAKGLIKRHEGLRDTMYLDTAGNYTIGYGHCLKFMPISEKSSESILEDDLQWFVENIPKHIPWFNELNDVRQAVILDMAFNLGIIGLLKFKKMMLALADKNWDLAAHEMVNSSWTQQVGQRAFDDARMMRSGIIE